eukprot:gene14457-14570_t
MHKGWLGGWLMPQEKSYFSLRLPSGWWVFGLDLALVGDIDMCQYRYFANVVERRLGPHDNVIIITHEPIWLLERLGRKNLHLFRFKNSRFDVIGGAIYFLSIVSILPRCSAGLALLGASSCVDFMTIFTREFLACWYAVLMESYLSLGTALLFFALRTGGSSTQLLVGSLHAGAHLSLAIVLLLLLELGVEVCI